MTASPARPTLGSHDQDHGLASAGGPQPRDGLRLARPHSQTRLACGCGSHDHIHRLASPAAAARTTTFTDSPRLRLRLARPHSQTRLACGCGLHYHMTQPPSTMSAWPVMYRASSEARNTAAAPMSSGSCSHFIGTMSATRFSNTWRGVMPLKAGLVSAIWAASFCQKSVQRTPGQIALTVTRCGASSLATTRVKVITPCLATLYGGIVTAASGPAMDAMLMIRPFLFSMKYGAMALHARNTDFVFTAKVRSQSSSVLFVNGIPGVDPAPALFTRMSIFPSASRVRSTIALMSAELVTSAFIATTLRPSALTSVATFSAFSTWMSGMAISAPSRAIASTIPRPMPLPPPVTTATLPASRMQISFVASPESSRTARARRAAPTSSIIGAPEGSHDSTPAQEPQLVRAQRPRRLRPPLVAQDRRVQRSRLRRPSHDRHRQLVVRAHQLQRPSQTGGRRRQAGRVERWGLPPRVPDHLSRRSLDEAHGDDVPESHGDGRRGVPARLSARRGRAPLGV